ncbi:hypothetical protein AAZX31_08G281000 [Glycine max]
MSHHTVLHQTVVLYFLLLTLHQCKIKIKIIIVSSIYHSILRENLVNQIKIVYFYIRAYCRIISPIVHKGVI